MQRNRTGLMKWIARSLSHVFEVHSRQLTLGEKQLAESVFGTHLQLDKIKIIAHRLVLKNYAISPNGNIYFHPASWSKDFSKLSLVKQAWLIHELISISSIKIDNNHKF